MQQACKPAAVADTLIPMDITELARITDIYLPENDNCFVFSDNPDAKVVAPDSELGEWLEALRTHIQSEHRDEEELHVRFDGYIFRGHQEMTVDGMSVNLRCIPDDVPAIKLVPGTNEDAVLVMPKEWREALMSPSLLRGGLILYIAEHGQGKSSLAAATIRSRLERFGGLARCLEDPPELNLQGSWGNGACFQIPVTATANFEHLIRGQMRAFPAVPGKILLVGEVRDSESAAQMIRAAASGILVLATLHASSIEQALSRLVAMAKGGGMTEELANDMIAGAFKIAIAQRMLPNPTGKTRWQMRRLNGQMLINDHDKSAVANTIRSGNVGQLTGLIDQQQRQIKMILERVRNDPEQRRKLDLFSELGKSK